MRTLQAANGSPAGPTAAERGFLPGGVVGAADKDVDDAAIRRWPSVARRTR
ncbi:MAG: hypothetical protein ACXV2E_07770 [Halobacteriota archaeon]